MKQLRNNTKKIHCQIIAYIAFSAVLQLHLIILQCAFLGADVSVSCDVATDQLVGIFVQDAVMKANYEAYPEVLFIDATYKLLDTRMPEYLLIAEDAMGQKFYVFTCAVLQYYKFYRTSYLYGASIFRLYVLNKCSM